MPLFAQPTPRQYNIALLYTALGADSSAVPWYRGRAVLVGLS